MTQIDFLVKQTDSAYDWTNKIINSIPHDKWDHIPEGVDSNVSWQVGHLIMSFYYHSIMVIVGHQMDILQNVPLKEYDKFFTSASPKESLGKTDPIVLLSQLELVQKKSIDIIKSLSPENLEENLHPSPVPHPIAKNKFEALDWNIKHAMWHCGQLGILKRIINERYDFGLRKS